MEWEIAGQVLVIVQSGVYPKADEWAMVWMEGEALGDGVVTLEAGRWEDVWDEGWCRQWFRR